MNKKVKHEYIHDIGIHKQMNKSKQANTITNLNKPIACAKLCVQYQQTNNKNKNNYKNKKNNEW